MVPFMGFSVQAPSVNIQVLSRSKNCGSVVNLRSRELVSTPIFKLARTINKDDVIIEVIEQHAVDMVISTMSVCDSILREVIMSYQCEYMQDDISLVGGRPYIRQGRITKLY